MEQIMSWVERVLLWDENRDPAQAPPVPGRRPWHMLTRRDREVLDILAEAAWMHEDELRAKASRGRVSFFVTTMRMVEAGWIQVRPVSGSLLGKSEYRLSPGAW